MPKATKIEQEAYPLPEDYYPAVLQSVTEKEVSYFKKDRHGNKTNEQAVFAKWVWTFEITSGEYRGETIDGETPAEYTNREDNLVRQWGETLLGRELDLGEELDTDVLEGLPCVVSVRHGEPRQRRAGGLFYPIEIDEVLPRSGSYSQNPPF